MSGVTGNDIVMGTVCPLCSYISGMETCRHTSQIHSLHVLFKFIFFCAGTNVLLHSLVSEMIFL